MIIFCSDVSATCADNILGKMNLWTKAFGSVSVYSSNLLYRLCTEIWMNMQRSGIELAAPNLHRANKKLAISVSL